MRETQLLPFERLLTFGESNLIKNSILKAVEVFESWGYNYIKLPAFDHYRIQEKVLGENIGEVIALKDTRSSDLISLRADFTTQVVRAVSFLGLKRFPVRAYYFGTLFRESEDSLERFQTGIELLGVENIEGDGEVISAIWDFLKALGVKDITVSIGNVNIVKKILKDVPTDRKERVKEAFRERNLTVLRESFREESVVMLPLTSGKSEALELLSELGFEKEREELETLGSMLEEKGINYVYDLSEVREFPYYTGIVFEFFHPSIGLPIAGGGRYDKLSQIYGEDIPATGGTVYIESLTSILNPEPSQKDFFVIDNSQERALGFKVASVLRSKGYRVGRDIVKRSTKHSLEYAFLEGYKKAVVITDRSQIRLYTSPKDFTTLKLKELFELV